MTIIHDSDHYAVKSYGNGASYLITCKRNGYCVGLQGDDATVFRTDFDAAWDSDRIDVLCSDYDDVMKMETNP